MPRVRRKLLTKVKISGVTLTNEDEIKAGVLLESRDWKPSVRGLQFEVLGEERSKRSLNSTFLVPIPKRGGAVDLKDFRLISLVGGLYKLLAKVLTNRLKMVVGEMVSENQHPFIQCRQILDAVLIVSEVVDSRLKSNIPGFLLKMDIEKAYDHVD
ncbi:hypothetical protein CK203_094914 [Vitis vinifera]|uniref:Reverse transcriptase domain-containing protein n=1 Tax=Vitis vinifera TaxID=29760 RepID=A0A438DNB0_VITVI|nr:hypothetical protein CK203_094914 [Vitis vinifera]